MVSGQPPARLADLAPRVAREHVAICVEILSVDAAYAVARNFVYGG